MMSSTLVYIKNSGWITNMRWSTMYAPFVMKKLGRCSIPSQNKRYQWLKYYGLNAVSWWNLPSIVYPRLILDVRPQFLTAVDRVSQGGSIVSGGSPMASQPDRLLTLDLSYRREALIPNCGAVLGRVWRTTSIIKDRCMASRQRWLRREGLHESSPICSMLRFIWRRWQ